MGTRSSTPPAMIKVVTMEDTATPMVATASPSSVPEAVSDMIWAFTTTGTFRFMTLPVRKVIYAEEPRIGV